MAIAEKIVESFLFRLRKQDTPMAVSGATVSLLMQQTGLTRTEVTHLALRQLADRCLPKYELDDGPLTAEQIAAVRAASSATDIADGRFTQRLF